MKEYSETAWNIASKYSHVLASETRDLAAWIDDAMKKERAEIERLRAALDDAIDYIDPTTDPWLHATAGEMAKRLRAYQQSGSKTDERRT